MRKTTMVTGIWLLAVGIVLATIGLLTNAPKTVVWNNGLKVSRSVSIDKNLSSFNKIKISDGDGDVEIKGGSDYSISIEGDEIQAPKYRLKNETLYIDKKQRSKASFTGNETVVVTVPQDKQLQKIDLEVGRDGVTMSNVDVKKLVANGVMKSEDFSTNKLTLDNVNVADSAQINLNYSRLNTLNSQLNNLTLISRGDSTDEYDDEYDDTDEDFDDDGNVDVTFSDTSVTKASIQANASDVDVRNSVLEEVTTSSNYGRVRVIDTTLKGINEFKINTGVFSGRSIKTDDVDLSNNKGLIKYMGNSTNDHVYQADKDAQNLLRVSGDRLRINVK
ncbi:DUF4097 family beta strand repeat-containing protein [Companilactobacillus furfuricola]|uniref:DUF4097 family beta strand repeat-containing protein n=1 Tax=Companilactobacillus furfuricola TaxID=1462575 RepID=UPI0013DE069D|nr:DUF4097 family beta strand repeat-containing protein [Companilactobacillus furfuricola]